MRMKLARKKFARQYRRSPTFLLGLWFFVILLVGTLLLTLPVSQRTVAAPIDPLTALFTAVSAFCVTGLTVVDTHDSFSFFGQWVILVLIELGGVGIMTFAGLAFSIMGRRLSMAGQAALTDAIFQNDAALEFGRLFGCMLKAVAAIQAVGAAALYLSLGSAGGATVGERIWSALFHSVSAFCNAGFSIYRNNLESLAGNKAFLFVIAALVVLGGFGHATLAELYRLPGQIRGTEKKPHWLSLNSRVALTVTAILLALGAISVSLSDWLFSGDKSPGVFHSIFHSVIARTAGFNSTPLAGMPLPSCLFLCLLMFAGGSPGSCAGGVKTTSLAIWIARIRANLRHDSNVNLLGYSIARDLVSKARIIMALSVSWVVVGVVFLSISQPGARLDVLLFEQVSAFATVGLTMGYTPELSAVSRLWIIVSMIMGKFGPLTVALWMISPTPGNVRHPEGRLMIG